MTILRLRLFFSHGKQILPYQVCEAKNQHFYIDRCTTIFLMAVLGSQPHYESVVPLEMFAIHLIRDIRSQILINSLSQGRTKPSKYPTLLFATNILTNHLKESMRW